MFAVACGKSSPNPISPSGAAQVRVAAEGDVGLKASAPTPVSPINGQKPSGALELVARNATMLFQPAAGLTLSYRFDVFTLGGARLYQSPLIPAGSGGTTSHSPVVAGLVTDQQYRWEVYAEFDGTRGPAASATFTASRPAAFITDTTLWDPLDMGPDGFAARNIFGPHTWIPGVGLRLDAFESHVFYTLPDGGRIEEGEFSAIISGAPENTEGAKTKVFAMSSGYHDLTTNEARMTVEKRGEFPTGGVAWRFLTTGEGAETIGDGERTLFTNFSDGPYFWEATWRHNVFRLRIEEGGPGGEEVYNLAKGYDGFYNPVPHVIWLGSQHSRSGPENWTVPGMIIRKVWVSWDPRPAYAN
jgi:hypothetical protein